MTKSTKKSWKAVRCALTAPKHSHRCLSQLMAETLNSLGAGPGDVIQLPMKDRLEDTVDLLVFTDKEVSDKPYHPS